MFYGAEVFVSVGATGEGEVDTSSSSTGNFVTRPTARVPPNLSKR